MNKLITKKDKSVKERIELSEVCRQVRKHINHFEEKIIKDIIEENRSTKNLRKELKEGQNPKSDHNYG